MPRAIEVIALRIAQTRQAESRQDVVEYQAMQIVDGSPAELAPAHPIHGRLVTVAPGQRKRAAISGYVLLVRHCRGFTDDATVPVDDGAEDVEENRARFQSNAKPICATGAKVLRCNAHGPKRCN